MLIEQKPIILSVVGHTNTGKTSLIRTLLRDSSFGDVDDAAGTTRHVESAVIKVQNQAFIDLRDTPGMEDSVALYQLLLTFQKQGLKERECLKYLLEHGNDYPEFEQELKVVRQALSSNVLLYVIDCREGVFDKYLQEISILSMASIPILPILNFVSVNGNQKQIWRQALAEVHLHACVEFDTVAFDFNAELRLYQKLQVLLESSYSTLQQLMDDRSIEWQSIRIACIGEVSQLILDVVSYSLYISVNTLEDNKKTLQNFVRNREYQSLTRILAMLQFEEHDVDFVDLPIENGRWQLDLFSPAALKAFGMDAVSAAATGAAIGVGVDLLLAGLSLGAASATGAVIGATWSASKRYGKDILATIKGESRICVDATTIELAMLRQLSLLQKLFHRGHADQKKVQLNDPICKSLPEGWRHINKTLNEFRQMFKERGDPIYQSTEKLLSVWIGKSLEEL